MRICFPVLFSKVFGRETLAVFLFFPQRGTSAGTFRLALLKVVKRDVRERASSADIPSQCKGRTFTISRNPSPFAVPRLPCFPWAAELLLTLYKLFTSLIQLIHAYSPAVPRQASYLPPHQACMDVGGSLFYGFPHS